jgi:membrane protein DedA with SNARE-associated domain
MIKALLIGVIDYLAKFGHFGIFTAMTLESACIPLPSEVSLPLGGYLVYLGTGSVLSMAIVGTLGCLIGSWIAYVVGYFGGRPFILKYGKYFFVSKKDLDKADNFFKKHGDSTIFFSRLLPVIRTFISLPAGITRMNFYKFTLLTVSGSFPWCLLFVFLGFKFGENYANVEQYFTKFNYLIIAGVLGLVVAFIVWKLKERKKAKNLELKETNE